VAVGEALSEDLYAAGGEVDIGADLQGDLVAAGGRVRVRQRVQGDVTATGGEVTVLGEVQDDVRAAGGEVSLEGAIGGDAVAAGGRVVLRPGARVAGSAWLAGGTVEVGGHVQHRVRAAGRRVRIAGQVDGNVEVAAMHLEVLPGARIRGALSYRSPNVAQIDPGAQIGGPVTHRPSRMADRMGTAFSIFLWAVAAMLLSTLAVAGIAMLLLFPDAMARAGRTIASDPGKSLLLGLLLLFVAPVAVAILMATLVGIPLAFGVLALYAFWSLFGLITGIVFLGDLGLRLTRRRPSRGWQIVFFLVALALLGLLQGVPLVGSLLVLAALIFGLGAWSLQLSRRYRAVAG
jgi:cytoskeletal protein CcmA (bactofilin family)